ncbi:hypothetical protein A5758_24780 [Mycobacterium sp. 852014-50255_SCH5639931]|nr:hypothetical protein A5758_24780 [Mycobacterium sp. 852014-50255_SCH5639931]
MDYAKLSDQNDCAAYEVEFSDADDITQAVVMLFADDLEAVWRPAEEESRIAAVSGASSQ